MKPIGPLMWEHRLIEQIIPLMQKEILSIRNDRRTDIVFIERAVDFFRTYADRTHHGKEEDILFAELEKKPLTEVHRRIMGELQKEHVIARGNVRALIEARQAFLEGDNGMQEKIAVHMTNLVELYPRHIEKEDKAFFFPVMEYFTSDEQGKMLESFYEFDRKMIHEKYQNIMEGLGAKVKRW
ncbi:MAG TPA: hemerythrin domain-containing protein [Deltaproteobacteria bacterium]|nr:hemerythrin domain-containing protein [Deltaproteobacteria bacterium]